MNDAIKAKNDLLEYVYTLNQKFELSKTITEDYFEPGMMENLEQYKGEFNEVDNIIVLRVDAKGLRYDNRTQNLEKLQVGDTIQIIRDMENQFNHNNFNINANGMSLGTLPAELCNVLAPLYDNKLVTISSSKVSYIERLRDRSRYAKQGVLFIEINIILRGI